MPRTPIVEQNVETTALPSRHLGASIRPVSNPFDDSAFKAQAKFGDAVSDAVAVAQKNADETRLLEAQKAIDDWEATNLLAQDGAFAKRGKDALDVPVQYLKKFDDDMQGLEETLTGQQKAAFEKMKISRRGTIQRTLYDYSRKESEVLAKDTKDAAKESGINRATLFFNRPEIIESSIKNAQDAVISYNQSRGVPDEVTQNELLEVDSKARLGVLTRLSDANPKSAVEYYKGNLARFTASDLISAQKLIGPAERRYKATDVVTDVLAEVMPKVSRDEMIDFVMLDLEGGDKVVPDGDGVAKYGRNSKWNKEIDVPNLTEDQARQTYADKEWKWVNADSLPADFRLVAFDAAVNHGMDAHTKKMIEDAAGDPRKLIEIRAKYYAQLAKENPEKHAAMLPGWMSRLGKLSAQVDLMRGRPPSKDELYRKIDAKAENFEIADDAKALASKILEAQEKAQTEAEKLAADEAAEYVASGQPVPASVEARMSATQVRDLRAKAYDPATYERLRSQIAYGQPVDLEPYRFSFGPRYDELRRMQTDPALQAVARDVDYRVMENRQAVTGKSDQKKFTKDNYDQLQAYRSAVYSGIEAFEKTTGKKATADDIEKIADDLVKKRTGGFWGTGLFEFSNIDRDRDYVVGGQQIGYDEMISNVTQYLIDRDIPVSEESLYDAFVSLRDKGLIKEKYAD